MTQQLAASPGASVLGFLRGDWTVARQIADYRTGACGSFRGQASFTPVPGGIGYTEQGELRFGSHRGPASRSLIYRGRSDGGADVQFADGREFFRLDLSSGTWHAEHLCRDDRYAVTVTVLSADSFTETWQVAGPAKDYAMTARYVRADAEK